MSEEAKDLQVRYAFSWFVLIVLVAFLVFAAGVLSLL